MARYIDADKLIEHLKDEIKACEPVFGGRANGKSVAYGTELGLKSAISFAETLATADVVQKSEVDNLEYTLLGVMHFVDKWLDGAELEQNEVNRAFLMRAKTLLTIEKLQREVLEYEETTGLKQAKQDVARKIFAEIEEAIEYAEIEWGTIFGVKCCIAGLKKKYTDGAKTIEIGKFVPRDAVQLTINDMENNQ